MDRKLKIELVPDSCWYSNLRSLLSKAQWDFIKKDAKERAQGKCAICGKKTDKLEAHEQWAYDESKGIQKLANVISVCKDCHSVIHMGRTSLVGNLQKAEDHYMKVNNCSYAEMKADIGKANEEHVRRNKVSEWKLDLSWLKRFIKD
ncbi:MAG: HNH endonuclease [Clostridia bacterium]|nr:HNH endonuclease [Clostridia bacterium]